MHQITIQITLCTALWAIGRFPVTADQGPVSPAAPAQVINPTPEFQELITGIVRQNIPDQFETRDDWGKTKEVWDGLHIRLDGLRLDTKRRKKTVNHGAWKLYRIRLIDPNEQFQIRVDNIRTTEDGRVAFDAWIQSRLDLFGRLSQWERGVQLFSLSANADAAVVLTMGCSIAARLDPTHLPPDVVFDARIESADLQMTDFRLRRISDVSGPIVRELGRGIRDLLEDELRKRRHELPERINRQIAKNPDRLRLSLRDVLDSRWGGLAAETLGVPTPTEEDGEDTVSQEPANRTPPIVD